MKDTSRSSPKIRSSPKFGVEHHWLALLGYSLLTTVVTWPVVPRFLTHIPGGGDGAWFLWQLWWFKHALLDLRQLPYRTDLIYYPLTDVPVTAQTPLNEIFSWPLQVAIGLVPLYNTLFLLSYILSGYFTYLLGMALFRRRTVAFVGGVIFAFCAYRGMRGLGHLSLLTTEWMPLALLLALQCWRRPSWQRGAATGIVTALVALSSPYYVGLFLLPVLMMGGLYLVATRWRQLWRAALWRAAIIGAVIAFTITFPFYFSMLLMITEIHTVNQDLALSAWLYSADLLSWVLPPGFHPLWGGLTSPFYANFTTPNMMETTVFVGFLPLLFALATFVLRRPLRAPHAWALGYWQLVALMGFLLAFGPSLHIGGQKVLDGLPFQWLLAIPGFEIFRIPSRAGITATLALSVLTMSMLVWLQQRLSSRQWQILWPLVALLILVNNTPLFPYPTSDSTIPAPYRTIATAADRTALLELPGEYIRNIDEFYAAMSWFMYYQTYHQRPMISGYLGRRPERLTYPEGHIPFVRQFFQWHEGRRQILMPPLNLLPEPFWTDEIRRAEEILTEQGITDVLLHCPPVEIDACTKMRTLLQQSLGAARATDETVRHYQAAPRSYTSTRAPAYLTTPPLTVEHGTSDRGFGTVRTDEEGRRHIVSADGGTIAVTLPFPGIWSIGGRLVGHQAEAVTFAVDGVLVVPSQVTLDPDGVFHWEQPLSAGEHRIELFLDVFLDDTEQAKETTSLDSAPTDQLCVTLCLYNPSVQLVEISVPTEQPPVATFINEAGTRVELLATTILTMPATVETNLMGSTAPQKEPPLQLLVNTWRLDDNLHTLLHESPTQLPVNYLHLTDEAGTVLAQADHPIGERHIDLHEQQIILDLVPLPAAVATLPSTELRLGLWYPDTAQYFWSPDGKVDAVGRVNIGELADLRQLFPLPPMPLNAQLATTFTNAEDGRSLRLLDAFLTLNPTTNQLQLATVWEQRNLFIPTVSVTLLAHLTDQNGVRLQEEAHLLTSQQLTWHNGEIRYDLLDLPQSWIGKTHSAGNFTSQNGTAADEIRIALIYLDSGQRYQADRPDLVDADGRVRLGPIADLLRSPERD